MIKKTAIGAVCALLACSQAYAAGEAKNVIFFLGDGMGPVTVTATRLYKVGEDGKLSMETLPYSARIKTFSNDGQTTDSAPSMAAYMTGVKMNNEVISMATSTVAVSPSPATVDGVSVSNGTNNCPSTDTSVQTILELAKSKGKAVGAITTTELTHATPATTYSHICNRNAPYHIARQAIPGGEGYNAALGSGVDVLMGGGRNHFTPFDAATNNRGRPDKRDLTTEAKAQGYTYVTTKAEMDAASSAAGTKLLGLFTKTSHLAYNLDRKKAVAGTEVAGQPSLAEMTLKAISVLSKDTDGYFLMVEGGRIDHALHDTSAKRALEDTIAFDDAIKAALDNVDLSNTLIVVTADHDHSMAFNGYPKKGNPVLGTVVDYASGLPSKDADGKTYTTLVFGNGPNRVKERADVDTEVAQGDDYKQESNVRVGAGSETHGGGDVMLFAGGAGSKTFRGTMDNTKVFQLLKTAFGF